MKKLLVVIISLMLTGCSILSPVKETEQKSYFFDPTISGVKAKASGKTILVTTPQASAGYTTAKMAYMEKPSSLAYYTRNRWLAPPAKMLQPLLVQALQKTGRFKAVAQAPYSGKADYRLDTDLIYVRQNLLEKPNTMDIAVQVRLIDNSTQRILDSKRIFHDAPTMSLSPYDGVMAANEDLEHILAAISRFTIYNTKR